MNNNLLILGAGGHGRVVKETAEAMDIFDKTDFLDDNSESKVAIGLCCDFSKYINEYSYAFVGIGNHELRMNWINILTKAGYKIPVLIHPTAFVSPSAKIYEGSIVGAKAVVNTNVVIEKGCIISIGVLIDHDSYVSQYSHINTGAIIKAGCKVKSFNNVDAGRVYSGDKKLEDYSFEVGV